MCSFSEVNLYIKRFDLDYKVGEVTEHRRIQAVWRRQRPSESCVCRVWVSGASRVRVRKSQLLLWCLEYLN